MSTAGVEPIKNPKLYTTVHYSVQTCDIVYNNLAPGAQRMERFACATKDELVRKCLTSFFESLEYCVTKIPYSQHYVRFFDDHSTPKTIKFLNKLIKRFSSDNIHIDLVNLKRRGIMNSTKNCFKWMDKSGKQLVYQIQDDFLFRPNCIFEMIDIFNYVLNETENQEHIIVLPFNDPRHWLGYYKYKLMPRMVVPGRHQYWLTAYDLPSGFMTSVEQFRKHWDLYDAFLKMDSFDPMLEPKTINKICYEYRAQALRPFTTLAFHMQTEYEEDPYTDWRPYWDAVQDIK